MRCLSIPTVLIWALSALSAPVPTDRDRKQLEDELALPPLGVADARTSAPLKLDLKGTDLAGKYADGRATSPELRKVVREAQVLLWASSPVQPPAQLREEVRKARPARTNPVVVLRTNYLAPRSGPATKAFQNQLLTTSRDIARLVAMLEEKLEEMQALSDAREKECPRWQAHHDLIVACLRYRIAYLDEHAVALGAMRKELPPRDDRHRGWKLVPRERVGEAAGKKQARAARATFAALTRDHAGTAWAQLAAKLTVTPLSVEWAPLK
jgi:hypothetical protein